MQARRFTIRVICAFAGMLLAAPALHAQQGRDGTVAKLVQMNGNVLVSRESGLATGNEAARLLTGTRVITTANSNVVVEYDNGCRVRLEENQRFEVENKPCALLVAQNLFVAPVPTGVAAATIVPAIALGAGAALIYDTRKQPPVSPN